MQLNSGGAQLVGGRGRQRVAVADDNVGCQAEFERSTRAAVGSDDQRIMQVLLR